MTILDRSDTTPIPVRERHLCPLVASICGESVVKLGLGLVDGNHVMVAGGVEEGDHGLRCSIPCLRCVLREGAVRKAGVQGEQFGWGKLQSLVRDV